MKERASDILHFENFFIFGWKIQKKRRCKILFINWQTNSISFRMNIISLSSFRMIRIYGIDIWMNGDRKLLLNDLMLKKCLLFSTLTHPVPPCFSFSIAISMPLGATINPKAMKIARQKAKQFAKQWYHKLWYFSILLPCKISNIVHDYSSSHRYIEWLFYSLHWKLENNIR